MKISVIVTTVRMGGFDVLYHGLVNQTFEDYEVIIVDSCFRERCAYQYRDFPNNWIHLELPDKFDYYDACYANNYGLRLARGELIVFLTDNIWLEPKCLERHWQIYTNFPGYSMAGFIDRYDLPSLKFPLDWQNCWWSVFESEFDAWFAVKYFDAHPVRYAERKGGAQGSAVPGSPYFELPGDFFYAALNESIPRHVLKEINGWNEDLDGGRGSADIELGMRANIAGWKFLTYPESINKALGANASRTAIPGKFKKNTRTPDEQRAVAMNIINDISSGVKSVKIEHGAWS